MITTLPDFGEGRYVSFLEAFLEKRIREKKLGKKAPELLAELTYESGENIQKQELKALLELAVEIQKANIGGTDPERLENELNRRPEIKKRLSDHVKAFEWAYFGYTGPVLTEKKVLEELALMQKEEKHAEKELERMKRESIQAEQKKKEAQKALDLSPREREWFQVASDAVFTKTYRRDATTYSFYRMTPLLREVSRRTKMPLERVQCIMAGEMNEVLENPKAWEPELKARQEYCICTAEGEAPRMYSGKEAKAYAKRFIPVEKVEDVNEIVGKCACPGIAVGRVRVIDTPTEMHGMKKGDILVSTATQPDIVPAMKKAAAIVTNIGGITSHAAIVSRELGVPCVIGTRIATKVLKNGDLVEVDATNGIVKKIKEWPKKEKTIFQ
ncbi:hypothetical protein KJ765_01615 [Candidatus Micrarchaeota archaeon]|nr:hypothetical protein [Candidatus Micrarchaeota archaeon]